jgi:hypothetical protein
MALTRFGDKLLLAKREVTSGVAETLAGVDAIYARNLVRRGVYDKRTRPLDKPYRGATRFKRANKRQQLTFQTDLIGAITPGQASPIAPLLRACGLTQSLLVGPPALARYAPTVNADDDSTTIGFFKADPNNAANLIRYIAPGCRGTATLRIPIDDVPVIDFDMLGIYQLPTSVVRPTADYSAFGEIPDVTVDTWSLLVNSVAVNSTQLELVLGYENFQYHGSELRTSKLRGRETTGTLTCFDPGLSPNLLALADGETIIPIVSYVDAGAGKRVRITMLAQLDDVEDQDLEQAGGCRIPFTCIPTGAGNDDFILEFE